MDIIYIILFAVAAIPGGVLAYEHLGWLRRRQGQRIIVHTHSEGVTYDGLLVKRYPDGLLMTSVTMLGDNGATTKPAGDLFVPKTDVRLVQGNVS